MKQASTGVYGCPGHPNLDRDHDILFTILDKLKLGLHVAADSRASISAELRAYADAHFEHEEQLMERYRYPATSAHKEAHQQFRVQLEALVGACALPDAALQPLVAAIEGWIDSHLRDADARLADFLRTFNVERCDPDIGLFDDSDLPRE